MAEMLPLFYPPLHVILPHIPMGYVEPQNFCWQQWLPNPHIMFFLIDHNNWHHIAFRMGKAMVDRNSCGKLFTAAVSTRQYVPLGILVFLPSLPGMVKAELPATHIGWLVLPLQTLPNSPSSLMESYLAFFWIAAAVQ